MAASPSSRMEQRLQIRSLTIALAALLLTVLGFQAWILVLGHQRAHELIATRAANRAQAIANQVQGAFQQVDILLLGLRDHIDPGALGPSRAVPDPDRMVSMRRLLREHMARLPHVKWMHVFAADGHPAFSTLDPIPGICITDRAFFQQLRDQPDDVLAVSDILVSRSTGRWAIFLSRRLVAGDGSFAGIVLAALETESLGGVLTAVDQQNWIFALHDRTGRLAARRPHRAEQIGEPVDAAIRDGLPADGTGAAVPALGETMPMIWATQRIEGLPLATVAGYSQRQALEQWRRDLRVHLVVALLLTVGCASILVLHRRNLRAADEQHASEEYYRALFDASPDAVAVIEDGRVVDANRCYLQLFRVPAGHPVPPWELAPEVQPDGAGSAAKGSGLAAAAQSGGLQHSDWRCRRSDGGLFEADISLISFHHRGRRLLIAVIRDLTRMRDLEEQLRQGQKLEALGQLAGGVAHDFNNMLAAILGSAEIIAARSGDAQIRRYNTTIVSAAERASQLTRKLLSFARKGKILSTPVDLHHLLRETVALLERTIDPRVVVALRLHAPSAQVVGDPSQIQNAVLNLCLNARDAMPGGGSLALATDILQLDAAGCQVGSFRLDPGEYLRLTVADTGTGIAEEHLQRIFDPFFTTKEVGKGTGLGLASVYGTMVSHKGAISVASTLGAGTTFTLLFPLAPAGQVPERGEEAPPTGSGPVLVVDDEDMVRSAIALQLEDLGYTPIAVGDVASAESAFRSRHTELVAVLLDLVMPRDSGVDVAMRLRGIDPKVPIILVSGFPRNAEVKELLDAGVAGFLQKPFRQAELAQAIAQIRRGEG